MTVDLNPTGIVYTVTVGSSGQEYPLTFPYLSPSDVHAYYVDSDGLHHTMINGTDFTLPQYGVAKVTDSLPVNSKLAFYRMTPLTQDLLWVDGQAVYTPDIMQADDKLTLIVQELANDVDRSVKVSREDAAAGMSSEEMLNSLLEADKIAKDAANVAVEALDQLKQIIPVPVAGDEGKTLYVVDVDGTPKYVLVNTSGGTGSAGYVDYSIQARESSGRVEVNLAELQHPEMPGVFNPFVNIISRKNYNFVLESRSKDGFVIQLYKPNGSAGVDFAEYIEFGTFAFGEGHVFGEEGTGSDVEIVVSIPLPPIE